jgi:hypothetical protein
MSTERVFCSIRGVTVCLCALGFSSVVASADSGVVIGITAESGGLSATAEITKSMGMWILSPMQADSARGGGGGGGVIGWSYILREDIDFWCEDTYLGTLDGLGVTIYNDPEVNLNFSVQAGSSATTFHIASALLTFDTITSPEGQASAAFTLTDFDANSASLTGTIQRLGRASSRPDGHDVRRRHLLDERWVP